MEELKILETKPITWKTMTPDTPESFPCMVCHKGIATLKLKCVIKTLRISLVCCQSCASMAPAELQAKLKDAR